MAAPRAVDAQPLVQRRFGVHWQNGSARLHVSMRDFLDPQVRAKLKSGLPQTVVIQIAALSSPKKKPLAAYASTCRIVYDLWEEHYRIEVQKPGATHQFIARSEEHIVRRCLALRGLSLHPFAQAPPAGSSIHYAVSVQLNPLSERSLERIRRWIVRPSGGSGLGDDAFFGSFVRLFINPRIGSAEKEMRFRSQPIRVPP